MTLPGDSAPFATSGVAPIDGALREKLEHFQVDEVPVYEPSGEGGHLFVHFEKRDLGTPEAIKRIARALNVDPRGAGYAGMKDRRAITTQWASFEGASAESAHALTLDGIRVISAIPNDRKLRTGHLRANRFRLVLAGDNQDRLEDAQQVMATLAKDGVPSYYGAQRFGRDGSNIERARRWLLEGGKPPRDRFERKLLASSLQSELFNAVLAERMRRGLVTVPLRGDLLRVEASGGLFTTDDEDDARRRVAIFEISPTGPMFGPKMREPLHDAQALETELRLAAGFGDDAMRAIGPYGEGTRRPLRVPLQDVSVEPHDEGLAFAFTLPSGAYATVVMREVCKRDDLDALRE